MDVVFSVLCVLPVLVGSTIPNNVPLPRDCSDVYAAGNTLSGVYSIYTSGTSPVQVYCDMGCQGNEGKWTVIQRRMNGRVNFYRPWQHYKQGFGDRDGEYWLGLETLNKLTSARNYELRVDLQAFDGSFVYAHYTHFSVDSEAQGYRLSVYGFINGGAGNSLQYHNGEKFSTFDMDQDSAPFNCAKTFLGGFWYKGCHTANPNGIYLWGADNTHYAVGNVWKTWKGNVALKLITMKIRPVKNPVHSIGNSIA